MGTGPYTLSSYILDLTGVSFWYRRVTGIVRAAAGRDLGSCYWLDSRQRRIVIRESRVHVALWVVIAGASLMLRTWLAVELWIGPMLLTKWFHQLQNMGEHTGLPHDPDIFLNTRTLRGPAAIRWLVWNMSWHTAHHCFPGVPFYALPRLDAEIRVGLGRAIPTRGYIEAQRDIFSGLLAKA
jgi:fatty acid desaturase